MLDWIGPVPGGLQRLAVACRVRYRRAFGQRLSQFEKYRNRHDVREPASAVGRGLVRSEVTEMMQREWLAWVAASCPG